MSAGVVRRLVVELLARLVRPALAQLRLAPARRRHSGHTPAVGWRRKQAVVGCKLVVAAVVVGIVVVVLGTAAAVGKLVAAGHTPVVRTPVELPPGLGDYMLKIK